MRNAMALADSGFLTIGTQRLEYRMIGPRPDAAPTIVMLHEGLGCVGLWGDFPDKLQQATGAGVLVYSRAGYGQSSPVTLPRPLTYMHDEARETCRFSWTKSAFGMGYCSAIAMAPRSPRFTPALTRITASAASC